MSNSTLIGEPVDGWLRGIGNFSRFLGTSLGSVLRPPHHFGQILHLCYEVGVKTLPLITLTGVITGIVFTQQSRPSLAAFGAVSWLPSLVTLALVRSLAPLVTALVCAGRVGSSIGAELGSMRVTEQIDALSVSAVNPMSYLVVTRTIATTLMVPALTMYFGFVAFLGAFVNVRTNEGTSWTAFVQEGFVSLTTMDAGFALLRSITFGFLIGAISCYAGFNAGRGTRGVGLAANQAVVQSMLAVFLSEVLIVQVIALVRGGV